MARKGAGGKLCVGTFSLGVFRVLGELWDCDLHPGTVTFKDPSAFHYGGHRGLSAGSCGGCTPGPSQPKAPLCRQPGWWRASI